MTKIMTTTPLPKKLPGKEGLWFFIAFDMSIFALFFLSYMHERSKDIELFNQAQSSLNASFGGINTLILLTSSWFVVMAVRAAKKDRVQETARHILLAAVCGSAFLVLKVIEYVDKLQSGLDILTNSFFSFYFFLTGIHFLHAIGGTVILLILWKNTRKEAYTSQSIAGLESGATYWHMVDLLWIFIFPLLYLVR